MYRVLFEFAGLAILTDARDVIDDALSDSTSPLIKRLRMRLQFANSSEINRRLFLAKDAGYLHRFTTLPLRYNEYQRERLHVVRECPKEYIIANVITKGLHSKLFEIIDHSSSSSLSRVLSLKF